jgi:hypothetical protein
MRWMLAMTAAVMGLAAASPALGDPWKDESGHGRGWGKREWKQEYRDGPCRIERKWKRNGDYKEEVECDGPPWARGYIVPPPAPARGWAGRAPSFPPLPSGPVYGDPYRDDLGRFCREYQTHGVIDGRRERLYGTACLQPDGSWSFDN